MYLIVIAALVAAGESAKLDRTYLPPSSAGFAGGSPGSLQLPFSRSNEGSQSIQQDLPLRGFVNDHEGVVVEAALAGTRATDLQSGLGGPRESYGSFDSKVGDAAFRVTNNQFPHRPNLGPNGEPDLSAFQTPQKPSSYRPGNIQIVRDYVSNTIHYKNEIGQNKFNFGFETDNGIKIAQQGISNNGVQSQGGFSYKGDDGKVYSVVYTAGKDGYRPVGSHLPTPPPIPLAILKSLEQNARDEAAGVIDDGSYDATKYNAEGDYTPNDRQSNKFGDRPVSVSGFINQNQQAFVAPNYNGQFSFNDASKDLMLSKPVSSKLGSHVQSNGFAFNTPNNINTNDMNNLSKGSLSFSSDFGDANFAIKPLAQQKVQGESPFGKPSSNDASNVATLASGKIFPSNYLPLPNLSNQRLLNFANSVPLINSQGFQSKPVQAPFNIHFSNQGSSSGQNLFNKRPSMFSHNVDSTFSNTPSTYYQSSQSSRFPASHLSSSSLDLTLNRLNTASNQASFTTSFKPISPTKQPEITLSTPYLSFESINSDEKFNKKESDNAKATESTQTAQVFGSTFSELNSTLPGNILASHTGANGNKESTKLFGTHTNNIKEVTRDIVQTTNSYNNYPSNGGLSFNTQSYESTQFSQPQGPDHSYIYNTPNESFHSPLTVPGSSFSSSPIQQVTSSLMSQSSVFNNAPNPSISSMDSQGMTSSIKNTPPVGSPLIDGHNTIYQSDKFSQIPMSHFTSSASTISDQLSFKPTDQSLFSNPSTSAFSQVSPAFMTAIGQTTTLSVNDKSSVEGIQGTTFSDENLSLNTQQNTEEIYQYPKPSEELNSQTEKGNEVNENQQTLLSTPSSPERFTTQPNKQDTTATNVQTTDSSQTDNSKFSSTPLGFESQFGPQLHIQNVSNKIHQSNQDAGLQPGFDLSQVTPSNFNSPSNVFQSGQFAFTNPIEEPKKYSTASHTSTPEYLQFNDASTSSKYPSTNIDTAFQSTGFADSTAQFNRFNTQTTLPLNNGQSSEGPFGQTAQFNLQMNGQFPQESPDSKQTTEPETTYDSKPFTLTQTQSITNGMDYTTRRPITEINSFSISSPEPSSLEKFGNQQFNPALGQHNNKEFSNFQFGQLPQELGGDFGYGKSTELPSSSQAVLNRLNTQNDVSQFDQIGITSSDITLSTNQAPQFNTSPSRQITDSKLTTSSEYEVSQQSTTFSEPSTTSPSVLEIQTNSQTMELGQLYEYKKPDQSVTNSPQNINNDQLKPQFQFVVQANDQFDQQNILNSQKRKPLQFTVASFGLPNTQFTPSIINDKDLGTTYEDKTESAISQNGSTGLPSAQETVSFTLQTSDQSTGEIYEYNKPEQSLTTSSETDRNNGFGQQQQSTQSTVDGNTENVERNRPTSQLSQTTFSGSQSTQNVGDIISTVFSPETTQKPFNSQFAFHSTCCSGAIFKRPVSSNNFNPSVNSVDQNKASNIINQKETGTLDKQHDLQKTIEISGLGEKFGFDGNTENVERNQPTSQLSQTTFSGFQRTPNGGDIISTVFSPEATQKPFKPQLAFHSTCCNQKVTLGKQNDLKKASEIAGLGEKFGGPRKPPSYDETGYHY